MAALFQAYKVLNNNQFKNICEWFGKLDWLTDNFADINDLLDSYTSYWQEWTGETDYKIDPELRQLLQESGADFFNQYFGCLYPRVGV